MTVCGYRFKILYFWADFAQLSHFASKWALSNQRNPMHAMQAYYLHGPTNIDNKSSLILGNCFQGQAYEVIQ